jgi:CDP-glycerol glycerophosphotransferase (TagB/SpsB family)
VRFVEGPHYVQILKGMYPNANLVSVGYAKTDPLFWPLERRPRFDLVAAGLDPKRPTIMYAPTHAPSSFARMSDDFPAHFAAWNVIVKPHYVSFFSSTRRSHRRLMQLWAQEPNCYVAPLDEFDPVPFMTVSDLLISDASSVLFEFAATGKPVVLCDFLALPWYRRGVFGYRFRRRMDASVDIYRDLAGHAAKYNKLRDTVVDELAHPERRAEARARATAQLIGATDGKVCTRIADWLLANLGNTTRTRQKSAAGAV